MFVVWNIPFLARYTANRISIKLVFWQSAANLLSMHVVLCPILQNVMPVLGHFLPVVYAISLSVPSSLIWTS
jgi:hypothetical protein